MPSIVKKNVDPDFDRSQLAYVPIRYRHRLKFIKIMYHLSEKLGFKTPHQKTRTTSIKTIEFRPPDKSELEMISQCIRQKEIYEAFGFKRPVAVNYTKRKHLPNGYGTFEPVEFMVVVHKGARKLMGFFIIYEVCKGGRSAQEFDFAITDLNYKGSLALLLNIRIALLTYLFLVCGLQNVAIWKRESKDAEYTQSFEDYQRRLRATIDKKGPNAIQIVSEQGELA